MSDKVRVYEIAEEAGASSADVIAKAKDLGIIVESPQSAVSYEDAEEITKYIMTGNSSRLPSKSPVFKAKKFVEKKNIEVEKKTELKKVVISKPINKPVLKTQEEFVNHISKIVPKRRGLVVVKKNKPKEENELRNNEITESQPKEQKVSRIKLEKTKIKKNEITKEEISSNEQQIKSSEKDSNDYKEKNESKNNEIKKLFSSKKIDYKFEYKNILFKGVPGTVKSRTIDKIIENHLNLKEYPENILRINIHSSSSNSDLMQGIGINSHEGIIEYKEKQGLILNFIQKATFCPLQPFTLILEEIQENSLNELIGDLI